MCFNCSVHLKFVVPVVWLFDHFGIRVLMKWCKQCKNTFTVSENLGNVVTSSRAIRFQPLYAKYRALNKSLLITSSFLASNSSTSHLALHNRPLNQSFEPLSFVNHTQKAPHMSGESSRSATTHHISFPSQFLQFCFM